MSLLAKNHITGPLGILVGDDHVFLPVDNVGIALLIRTTDIPGIKDTHCADITGRSFLLDR